MRHQDGPVFYGVWLATGPLIPSPFPPEYRGRREPSFVVLCFINNYPHSLFSIIFISLPQGSAFLPTTYAFGLPLNAIPFGIGFQPMVLY